MAYDYGKQKLFEAVLSLVGSGSIQDRLTFAAVPLVILRSPERELPDVLPVELHESFNAIVDQLTKEPLSSAAGYTPRRVTQEDGEQIARQIFEMFVGVMGGL